METAEQTRSTPSIDDGQILPKKLWFLVWSWITPDVGMIVIYVGITITTRYHTIWYIEVIYYMALTAMLVWSSLDNALTAVLRKSNISAECKHYDQAIEQAAQSATTLYIHHRMLIQQSRSTTRKLEMIDKNTLSKNLLTSLCLIMTKMIVRLCLLF
jgi:hypothetical protein